MYMHEATKHPNKAQFIKAMQKKCYDQLNNGNLSLKHISEVPEGATILPVIWKIKRNRDTKTRQIKRIRRDSILMDQGWCTENTTSKLQLGIPSVRYSYRFY